MRNWVHYVFAFALMALLGAHTLLHAAEVAFADALALGESRTAGAAVNGQSLQAGGTAWTADGSIVFAGAGGATTKAAGGGTAIHPIPRIAGKYHLHAVFHPAAEGSIGFAIGGEGLLSDYYKSSAIAVGFARGGVYEVRVRGVKGPIKAGSPKDYGGADVAGGIVTDVDFDTVTKVLTVKINGVAVVDQMDLTGKVAPSQITHAGFRINGITTPGEPRIADYRVTLNAVATSGLSIVDASDFFVVPGTTSRIRWTAESVAGRALRYELVDYRGQPAGAGVAMVNDKGEVAADVTVPAGFYELRLPEIGEQFGVFASPVVKPTDAFFGMDAGLTWMKGITPHREALVKILARSGIGSARERMSWGTVDSASTNGDWEAGQKTDSMRKIYVEQGVKLLEVMYGSGAKFRFDQTVEYPQKFALAGKSWGKIAERWSGNWIGDEVWNEPDLVQLPADQYVMAVKLAAFVHDQQKIASPVISGAFTGNSPSTYHDVCSANGMLEHSDAVSFHTYASPIELGSVVSKYRAWFAANGKESMPLWLTEAGKAWPLGPDRPPIEHDVASAHALAALASEAKAVGIARIFPFIYTYFEEGPRNFGMMGREVTPLRVLAAYFNAVRVLSDKPYVGDLATPDDAHSIRVFGNADEQTIVIYMKKPDPAARVTLGVPVRRVEGIDGRALVLDADGSVPVPDGVAFAYAGKADLAASLQTDTPTRTLYEIAQRPAPVRGKASSVILQHVIDRTQSKMSSRRYQVNESAAKTLKVTVRAGNMLDTPQKVTLRLTLPGDAQAPATEPVTVEIPASGAAEATWTVDASKSLDVAEVRYIKVDGTINADQPISTLAIPYLMEGELETHLARHSYQYAVPVGELERWKSNLAENGKMTTSVLSDGTWRLDVKFNPPSTRWLYPIFRLPEPIDATRARGVLLRARILEKARNVAVMLRESESPGFQAMEIFPADGQWHVAYIPFGEFRPEAGNPDMQNAILKPERITTLRVGMGSDVNENAMEISHFLIVGQESVK